ncbi:MAG: hypothetical protein HOH24_09040 [Chromatiales bacterium]|jgi:hypothetical protein|nr:hypothetical protein [Chromatiales bacterium]
MSSVRVAHAYDFGTYAVMKSLLESEGMLVIDMAFGSHISIAGADQGYYLQVRATDQGRARTLLWQNSLAKYLLQEQS